MRTARSRITQLIYDTKLCELIPPLYTCKVRPHTLPPPPPCHNPIFPIRTLFLTPFSSPTPTVQDPVNREAKKRIKGRRRSIHILKQDRMTTKASSNPLPTLESSWETLPCTKNGEKLESRTNKRLFGTRCANVSNASPNQSSRWRERKKRVTLFLFADFFSSLLALFSIMLAPISKRCLSALFNEH